MRAQYQIVIALILLCGSTYASDTTNSVPTGKILVEVIFTLDNNPPAQPHFTLMSYLTEHKVGFERFIYDMDIQDGEGVDPDAQKKAAECIKLLKPLEEPKSLPDSPTQIFTVYYVDNDKIITKRFPIDSVPLEIHQTLKIMGCDEKDYSRLKFVKKAS